MRIREVWIRFYKSFNFDYELKAKPGAKSVPWQEIQGRWLPHVRVPIEDDITAVVGANESGKTHLLDAIRIALTGNQHLQRDFCRSSPLFSVEQDSRLYPEVGATLSLSETDIAVMRDNEIPLRNNQELIMLRPCPDAIDVIDSKANRVSLNVTQTKAISELLPLPHAMETDVALPDSVSISLLADSEPTPFGRANRSELLSLIAALRTAEEAKSKATDLMSLVNSQDSNDAREQELGYDLLTKVAKIDQSSFRELQDAIKNEREGLVNGLIQEMNNSIARHLNVSRWWTQDSEFRLLVSPREHELVFTIRDRTGTDYSFTERSRGLRYFLSYYVQLLSHERDENRSEVLLMDEPDAYLSASGQQDLLRVLENYSRPEDSVRSDQVVYVTHSPFLINRNAGHRVRVIDKGARDEGSRFVRDATQNHYEPLRTSLGASVAETAFIGGDNLFVEGIADQILIAGMNARLLQTGTPPSKCLNLNEVTIVAGGSSIPYMLYLARGRDKVKPACAVLLDGDIAGKTARKQIRRGGAHQKPTVSDDLIILLSEWASGAELEVSDGVIVREPEDLIPVSVAVLASRRYAQEFLGYGEPEAKKLKETHVEKLLSEKSGSLWDALEEAFGSTFGTGLTKAGFAKELIALLRGSKPDRRSPGVAKLDQNFGKLLQVLADTLRLAREREQDERRSQRLERLIDTFIADHPNGSTRDRAEITLRRMDATTDNTEIGDLIHAATARLRRDYKLRVDPLKNIDEYAGFLEDLSNIRHLERLSDQGRIGDTETG